MGAINTGNQRTSEEQIRKLEDDVKQARLALDSSRTRCEQWRVIASRLDKRIWKLANLLSEDEFESWFYKLEEYSNQKIGDKPNLDTILGGIEQVVRDIKVNPHKFDLWTDLIFLAVDGTRRSQFPTPDDEGDPTLDGQDIMDALYDKFTK